MAARVCTSNPVDTDRRYWVEFHFFNTDNCRVSSTYLYFFLSFLGSSIAPLMFTKCLQEDNLQKIGRIERERYAVLHAIESCESPVNGDHCTGDKGRLI